VKAATWRTAEAEMNAADHMWHSKCKM